MEYASNGKGNLAVTLGSIGTGLGLLSGTGLLTGFNGNGMANNNNNFVSKAELNYVQEIASKDSQIALLQAESASEQKMIEVYNQAHSEVAALRETVTAEVKELTASINANRKEQDAWNAAQAVANATMSASIASNTNAINTLQASVAAITQLKVPNTAVCPGWGNITITPSTSTTTTT